MAEVTSRFTAMEKRYLEIFEKRKDGSAVDAAVQFAEEMADARAEEIARLCEARQTDTGSAWDLCQGIAAALARSTISKPKTREQVLEEALRELSRVYHMPLSARTMGDIDAIIERALSRKS